ncbi:hypothetical protein ALC56_07602 [Trachymyrmex septentrionalis]|uniref:Uncharacterized protein n=1 Tax=Trachymyrmex septentrionalis TaxID=34720 RepID=A0A195FC40_9HYME|nr:hypothetical protein ALC56_07602 [Trachymyrmex septentrionalis]
MLCGELLNGGFVSAGAVPVVPYSLPGLWLPGCLRATSPRLLTSPYLTLLAELLAAGRLELRDDLLELMDLAKRSHQAPGNNGASELDLDLHADDIDEIFLGQIGAIACRLAVKWLNFVENAFRELPDLAESFGEILFNSWIREPPMSITILCYSCKLCCMRYQDNESFS